MSIEITVSREWDAATDPLSLFKFLRSNSNRRKLRLFACACVRPVETWLVDQHSLRLIDYVEHYADGKISADVLELIAAKALPVIERWPLAKHVFIDWSAIEQGKEGFPKELLQQWRCRLAAQLAAIIGIVEVRPSLVDSFTAPRNYWPLDAEAATPLSQIRDWFLIQSSVEELICRYVSTHGPLHAYVVALSRGGIEALAAFRRARSRTVHLLHDLFGDPFQLRVLDPSWLRWRDGTVPRVAAGIYEQRRFDELPILADALEEAGCTDAAMLDHCRVPSEHARGCWVVDALLGKK